MNFLHGLKLGSTVGLGVVVGGAVVVPVVGPAALGVQAKQQRSKRYPRSVRDGTCRFILAVKLVIGSIKKLKPFDVDVPAEQNRIIFAVH